MKIIYEKKNSHGSDINVLLNLSNGLIDTGSDDYFIKIMYFFLSFKIK